ncbi:MAG: DNA polymerase III subunit delta' C-terminal domain-containing protein [Eubacteriales bacterium]|nr:DNA polymerase III subunit delta' C-terminal domain-containing protein [Eubacteriales bacterium]
MNRFSEIIGQDMIVSHLQNALRTGGASHAYILNGAKGSGRHMIARSFSAALLCENPQEKAGDAPEPCGRCLSCVQAASGSNPDIITLEPEKESSIGVGDIRKMRADVQVRPYRASHKVYIIPGAEKMTVQAQNALLKTLEEPPAYAVLLLLADGTTNFLPTIMSRCVTLPLRPVAEPAVEACLRERFGADETKARLCARFSGGSIGRAALLLENEKFAVLREKTIALLRDITRQDAAELAAFAHETAAEEETQDFIDFVLSWNRDLMVCRGTHDTDHLIFTDEVQYIIEAAKKTSWRGLQAAAEAVFRARRRLFSNVNAELTLQMMLLEIRAAYRNETIPLTEV